MKKLLLLFLISLNVFAAEELTIDESKVPAKLHTLFKSINANDSMEKDLVALALEFNNIIAMPIDSEVLDNIIDIEITKISLTSFSPKKIDPNKVLDLLKEINAKKLDEIDLFYTEIEKGFIQEFNTLYETPFFRDFIRAKKDSLDITSKEVSVIEKKAKLIIPWIDFILKTPSQEKKIFSIKMRERIIRNLIQVISFLNKYQDKKSAPIGEWISLKTIIKKGEKVLPDGLPLSPVPSKFYKAPETLPAPTDAWRPLGDIFDLDGLPMTKEDLFPIPDEGYTAPEKLPEPTDEWILSP